MLRIPLCLSLCLFLTVDALADDAKEVFDSLYGAKIRQVSATIDRADDIALAKDMLAVAKDSGGTPALQALLCEAVYDLGAKHADGYAAAVEAMQLLAETQPKQREAAREKLIDLLTKQSRIGKPDERDAAADALIDLLVTIGDEKAQKQDYAGAASDYRRAAAIAQQSKAESLESVKEKLQWATTRDRTIKHMDRLKEILLRDANDFATAEEIVRLYVVDFDDPGSAIPYLNRVKAESLKINVPLAAKPPRDLQVMECATVGDWYYTLARDAQAEHFITMLRRAESYLSRFVSLDTTDGLQKQKATLTLKAVKEELDKIEAKAKQDALERFIRSVDSRVPRGLRPVLHLSFDAPPQDGKLRCNISLKRQFFLSGGQHVDGILGKAWHFNGNGDRIDLPRADVPDPIGRHVILAAWIKPEGRDGVIAEFGGDHDGIGIHIADGYVTAAMRLNKRLYEARSVDRISDQWVHVAGEWTNKGGINIYVNGERVGESAAPHMLNTMPGQDMTIGSDNVNTVGKIAGSKKHFSGVIDELMMYRN